MPEDGHGDGDAEKNHHAQNYRKAAHARTLPPVE
jgi:hypothetical protein